MTTHKVAFNIEIIIDKPYCLYLGNYYSFCQFLYVRFVWQHKKVKLIGIRPIRLAKDRVDVTYLYNISQLYIEGRV